jgi:hypothetical protein
MAYIANPVNFDGTNDSLTRGGGLTGIADGNIILFSCWFRRTGGFGATERIFSIYANFGTTPATRLRVVFDPNDLIEIAGFNSSGTNILNADAQADFNLSNSAQRHIYIDGVLDSTIWTIYNIAQTLDLAPTDPETIVGRGSTVERLQGDLADVYFTTPASWFDLSTGGNLAKFISGGAPVDLGADGSNVTGTTPLVFLSGPTDTWHTNDGSGGGFTEVGALTDGAVALPFVPTSFVFPPRTAAMSSMLVR